MRERVEAVQARIFGRFEWYRRRVGGSWSLMQDRRTRRRRWARGHLQPSKTHSVLYYEAYDSPRGWFRAEQKGQRWQITLVVNELDRDTMFSIQGQALSLLFPDADR